MLLARPGFAPPRLQSLYSLRRYVQRGCRVRHRSTTITHTLATTAVQTPRGRSDQQSPRTPRSMFGEKTPAKQQRCCHCFSLESSKTLWQAYTTAANTVHICTEGTVAVAWPLVRGMVPHTMLFKLLLYKLALCDKQQVESCARRHCDKAMSLSFIQCLHSILPIPSPFPCTMWTLFTLHMSTLRHDMARSNAPLQHVTITSRNLWTYIKKRKPPSVHSYTINNLANVSTTTD